MRCKANAQSQIYQKWMTDCDEQKNSTKYENNQKKNDNNKSIFYELKLDKQPYNIERIHTECDFYIPFNAQFSHFISVVCFHKFFCCCWWLHFGSFFVLFFFFISEILLQIFVCFVFFVSLKSSSYGCAMCMYYVTISELLLLLKHFTSVLHDGK